jgi:hypothetical protein
MGDPLRARSERFCWDWWHVADQYTLLRTPARQFFPAALYDKLEDGLVEYGERVLGCRGISPLWLRHERQLLLALWPQQLMCITSTHACEGVAFLVTCTVGGDADTTTMLCYLPLPSSCSCYVNGCRQNLHTDSPHGPFAFVLSLTDWEGRRFSGGETEILQPLVLDYWRRFDSGTGMETPQLVSAGKG